MSAHRYRKDVSINLEAVDRMLVDFPDADVVSIESGGDNLADTLRPELSNLTIYVNDVVAGGKIPHKGGFGITKSDLFVINKTDLARYLGAHLKVMEQGTIRMRITAKGLKPFVMNNLKTSAELLEVVAFIKSKRMRIVAWHRFSHYCGAPATTQVRLAVLEAWQSG